MKTTDKKKQDKATDQTQAVVTYLRAHQDFFLQHPDLLVELNVPHAEGDGVVSLIERQVEVLRQKHKHEQKQLYNLVQTARDNERLANRLHQLAIEVVGFTELDDALDGLSHLIKELFNVDYVSFRITSQEGQRAELVNARSPVFADLYHRVVDGRSECDNQLTQASKQFLFGEGADPKSVVLVPLGGSRPCGVLALGSSQEDRFTAEHGTFYLDRLGELVGAAIRRLSLG